MQDYRTIQGTATAEIEEKRSRFIANAAFVDTETAALAVLDSIKAQHRTARHNVYAYVLRQDARMRYSDDGEPAKTAGLPVLEVIRHKELTDCIVVVTRYFGGTLLGTGGLVRAYTDSTIKALAAANIVTVRSCVSVQVKLDYALYERGVLLLQQAGAKLEEPQFADAVTIVATLPEGEETGLVPAFQELTRGAVTPEISAPFYTPF